jgi:hypothetical protein
LSFVYLYLIEMQHSKNTDCNSERNFGTIALAQFTFEYLLLLGIYKRTIGSKLHSIDGLPRQTIHLVHAETLVAGMRREDREDQEMAEQYMNPHDLQLEMICPSMRAMIIHFRQCSVSWGKTFVSAILFYTSSVQKAQ